MIRILHLADLHLGWKPRGMPPEVAQERRLRRDDILRRAVDFALERRRAIDLVVIAGDLFDTPGPSEETVDEVRRQLQRLCAAHILPVTVPGHHDEISVPDAIWATVSDWPGLLVRNPTLACVATLDLRGTPLSLYGLAFTAGVTPADPLAALPPPTAPGLHVAVLHGRLVGLADPPGAREHLPVAPSPGRARPQAPADPPGAREHLPVTPPPGRARPQAPADSRDADAPVAPATPWVQTLDATRLAASGFHYVALGEQHAPARHDLGNTVVAYPGLVEGRGFCEPGCGHWTVATVAANRVSLETPPVAVQTIHDAVLDVGAYPDLPDLEEAVAWLADPHDSVGGPTIARVTLVGAAGYTVEAGVFASRLTNRFFHLEVVDHTDAADPETLKTWAREPTILGQFVRRMLGRLEVVREGRERQMLERALRYGVRALREGSAR